MAYELSGLQKYVVPRAPGAGGGEVLLALRSAAREFCRVTGLWKQEFTGIDVSAGTRDYELDPEDGSELSRIAKVSINGVVIGAARYDLVVVEGVPVLRFEENCEPTVTIPEAMTVVCEAIPADGSDLVDESVLAFHDQCIAEYAVYLLAFNPTSPSHNPKVADLALAEYHRLLAAAVHDRSVGRRRGSATMSAPAWL